jgi:hypothetical protein
MTLAKYIRNLRCYGDMLTVTLDPGHYFESLLHKQTAATQVAFQMPPEAQTILSLLSFSNGLSIPQNLCYVQQS